VVCRPEKSLPRSASSPRRAAAQLDVVRVRASACIVHLGLPRATQAMRFSCADENAVSYTCVTPFFASARLTATAIMRICFGRRVFAAMGARSARPGPAILGRGTPYGCCGVESKYRRPPAASAGTSSERVELSIRSKSLPTDHLRWLEGTCLGDSFGVTCVLKAINLP